MKGGLLGSVADIDLVGMSVDGGAARGSPPPAQAAGEDGTVAEAAGSWTLFGCREELKSAGLL